MQEVTIAQAKARLTQLVQQAERGEAIAITRNGKTVAHLKPADSVGQIPVPELSQTARTESLDRFLKRRAAWRGVTATQEEIRSWINEGRR